VKKLPKTINVTLKVWRQQGPEDKGRFETIAAPNISVHMSFIEMLDTVNEQLTLEGKEPIAFDNDCREGICGTCGAVVDGQAHGPQKATTLCQLHMRKFSDGDTIVVEPFRSRAFKVIKDLVVDRSTFDKIIQAGGFRLPDDADTLDLPGGDLHLLPLLVVHEIGRQFPVLLERHIHISHLKDVPYEAGRVLNRSNKFG